MNKKQFVKFLDLACQLSPENLSCDGELTRTQVDKRYKEIIRQWKILEKEIGRKVTEDEIWEMQYNNTFDTRY